MVLVVMGRMVVKVTMKVMTNSTDDQGKMKMRWMVIKKKAREKTAHKSYPQSSIIISLTFFL